ncbi:hypothetical protein ACLOJK_039209, partial [Asimina triloba]
APITVDHRSTIIWCSTISHGASMAAHLAQASAAPFNSSGHAQPINEPPSPADSAQHQRPTSDHGQAVQHPVRSQQAENPSTEPATHTVASVSNSDRWLPASASPSRLISCPPA